MLENELTLPKALRRNAYYRYQYKKKHLLLIADKKIATVDN